MKFGAIGHKTSEPAMVTPVTATADEVRLARELRRQIRLRYLNGIATASQPAAAWCVGAD